MTCMRSGTRWMLDAEQQQTSRPNALAVNFFFCCCLSHQLSSALPSLPCPLFLHICDQVVVMLSLVLLFLCVHPGFSTPSPSLAVSFYPFLPRSPHACLCFHRAALLSPCNLRPCQSHRWGTLDLRLLFGANTCELGLLVPSLCVTLLWMPRHFVLPVAVNSRVITRLKPSHLQARGSC